VPGETVDGNDVMAVDEAAGRLVAEVRSGKGPRLLQARTYRITGHTSTDAAAWRDPAEVAAAKTRDPIEKLAKLLSGRGVAASEIDGIRSAAEAEMAEAVADAKAAPWPDEAIAYDDVQDVGAVAFGGRA